MTHPNGWKVGMTVVSVITLNTRGEPKVTEQKIAKIGRRWITLDGDYKPDRFDADTLQLDGDGYSSPGRVYPTMSEYLASTEKSKIWTSFRLSLPFQPPDHLSADELRNTIAKLRGET